MAMINSKIRLLLVDDHLKFRKMTRQLIEQETDLEVIGEAGDGEEAIRSAGELKPDMVLLDVTMPKLNGIEATRKIKQRQPEIPIIMLTDCDDKEYTLSLMDSGANDCLSKDVTGDELIGAIRNIAAGKRKTEIM